MAIGYGYVVKTEKGERLNEDTLETIIGQEIARSTVYDDGGESERRTQMLNYVQGLMPDFQHKPNRSSYTSRETSDTIGWIMPGLMRVFAGGGRMPNYRPRGPGDEEGAEQASDYIQHQFFEKNDGYKLLYTASQDALMNTYGVVKQYWVEYPEQRTGIFTGMTEEQIAILEEEGAEILAVRPGEDDMAMDEQTGQMMPVPTFDVKLREPKKGHICYENIAGEDFFRDGQATCIEDARLLAHRKEMTRSELVQMGFGYDEVYDLPAMTNTTTFRSEKLARDNEYLNSDADLHPSMQKVEVYEVFIKIDIDGDGVAESVRAYYCGPGGSGKLLDWEEWDDEWPFDIIPANPFSYRFEGTSPGRDVIDIQQINTTLTRQLFDNLYATNVPMIEAEEGTVLNPETLVNPKFGAIIWRKKGSMGTSPVTPINIPFVGDKIVEALELTQNFVEKRTGVSRTTMALDPSAYQDQTATAAQLQTQASYSKIELLARNMAELGWKKVFRKSLKIMVKNQRRADTIRLRDKWVEVDPRYWNADMDCDVQVGLGTGTQEKDQMQLGQIYQIQLQTMGILENAGAMEDALAMIPKIVRTATRMAQASGIRDAAGYYPDLTEKDVPRLYEAMSQKASQEPQEITIKKMELEAQVQQKEKELQSNAILKLQEMTAQNKLKADENLQKMITETNKEKAQLQADLVTKDKDRQAAAESDKRKYMYEAWKTRTVEQNKWDIALLQARTTMASAEGEGTGDVDEDGSVSNRNDKRHAETRAGMEQMMKTISALSEEVKKPRRRKLIRDKDGRAIGAEDEV